MNETEAIRLFLESSAVSELDRHFARFMEKLAGGGIPELALAAALVSARRGEGDICLDLKSAAAQPLPAQGASISITAPAFDVWRERLEAAAVVGRPGDFKPLILDAGGRLYLHRYWEYEAALAAQIRKRVSDAAVDDTRLREGLARLFPRNGEEIDWQKAAAFVAAAKKLCVISGGPGTGKTTTVLKILLLLIEQAAPTGLRIALTAPTGKAAARLQESIAAAIGRLQVPLAITGELPGGASTIHRLLGWREHSPYFRHDAAKPLPIDVLVVDEASMVDLALMAKLLEATPETARVILLGDKDQLASVEAGAVLGDICSGASNEFSREARERFAAIAGEELPQAAVESPLGDCIVQLRRNYRFGERSGIFHLGNLIQQGRAGEAMEFLRANATGDVSWSAGPDAKQVAQALRPAADEFLDYLSAASPVEALERFLRFRILAALRQGPFGVESINLMIETLLEEAGAIDRSSPWYRGRPVMITRNDYNVRLFNGDIGIIFPDPDTGQPRAFFPDSDAGLRGIPPLRLPEHETVFAMTIHKSQGSEFEKVLMILPDRENPVVTRELVYTGITRARENVRVWGGERVLEAAIRQSRRRVSGLEEALWRNGQ